MVDRRSTIRFLKNRERGRRERLDAAYSRACTDFGRIVAFIIENYKPNCVWQWGSLLDRRRFSEISDIDIALEGMERTIDIFDIHRRAEEMTDFALDIVDVARIEPEYKALILEKGKKVYERT